MREPLLDNNPESAPESPSVTLLYEPSRLPDAKRALFSVVGYLLLYRLASYLPNTTEAIVVTTLASLFLILLFTVSLARVVHTPREWLALTVACAPFVFPAVRNAIRFLPGFDGLMMVGLAVSAGTLISHLMKEMKILLPAAVMLAMVDLYVVFGGGLVAQATSGNSPQAAKMMQALTVNLPTTQAKAGAEPLQLAVGFADFLFIALFFACFRRFGIPSRKTFQALTTVLILYMLAVAFTGTPLPALVPIAVVVISLNLRHFKYERSELFALLYAGLIVLALFGYLLHVSRKTQAKEAEIPAVGSEKALPQGG